MKKIIVLPLLLFFSISCKPTESSKNSIAKTEIPNRIPIGGSNLYSVEKITFVMATSLNQNQKSYSLSLFCQVFGLNNEKKHDLGYLLIVHMKSIQETYEFVSSLRDAFLTLWEAYEHKGEIVDGKVVYPIEGGPLLEEECGKKYQIVFVSSSECIRFAKVVQATTNKEK